jgi:hypothetical protein
MAQSGNVRRGSIGGAIIIIAIGVLFLIFNLRPDFNPWPIVARYWPLMLIFAGLGMIWDRYQISRNPDHAGRRWISGAALALLILAVLFGATSWSWHGRRALADYRHDTKSVERQNAKSVSANINIPAGQLTLSGAPISLLNADFDYDEVEGKPDVQYSVSDSRGQLDITQQRDGGVHMANTRNDWTLRMANDIPVDLKVNMGAGHDDLRLREMNVTSLEINMGAGELDLDLTGPRKSDLDATVQGGVGSATVRLPKDVAVEVHATGGIGSISAHGLKRDGDAYVNDAFGKTPASIKMTIQGGVGEIVLIEEP